MGARSIEVPPAVWVAHDSAPHDLYLLLAPDLPWTQDGTRELPEPRQWFFERNREELSARRLPHVTITGSGERRTAAAVDAIGAARVGWEERLRGWSIAEPDQ